MKPPFPKSFIRLPHKLPKRHLHGSGETLVRLARDTCTAHEQHLHGSRATQVWNNPLSNKAFGEVS